jgi:hypothetical protein
MGRARRVGVVAIALAFAALFVLPGWPGLVSAWSGADLDGAHRIHLLAQGWHSVIIP